MEKNIQLNLFSPEDFESFNPPVTNSAKGSAKDVSALMQKTPNLASKRIDDAGMKIGGARKDYWAGYRDLIALPVAEAKIRDEPLTKVFPAPDYERFAASGVAPWKLALVHAARDEIPPKPRLTAREWRSKIYNYVSSVDTARELASWLLYDREPSGRRAGFKAREMLRSYQLNEMSPVFIRAKLYECFGHDKPFRRLDVYFRNLDKLKGWGLRDCRTWNRIAFAADIGQLLDSSGLKSWLDKCEEEKHLKSLSENEKKKNDYCISCSFSTPAEYMIKVRRSGKYLDVDGPYASYSEARARIDNNRPELDAKLARMLTTPSERREYNSPRVGRDLRGGVNVTAQMFIDTFGFRGVEFGNWVEQEKRQESLNDAYDALMDLSGVLGIPPKAVSLNGQLGIGFGSRGRGGKGSAAAHYEPGRCVINLTKMHGAGSLGHEWMHAVDNYFAGLTKNGTYMSSSSVKDVTGVRPEMTEAFRNIQHAAASLTELRKRSKVLDKTRSKDYWSTPTEMQSRAFESYLIRKLSDKGITNDYLANIVGERLWARSNLEIGKPALDDYPYPLESEMDEISSVFDSFFSTLKTRETERGIEMYSIRNRDDIGGLCSQISISDIARRVKAADVTDLGEGKMSIRFPGGVSWLVDVNAPEVSADPDTVIRDYGRHVSRQDVVAGRTRVMNGVTLIELVSGMSSPETFSHEVFEATWKLLDRDERDCLLREFGTREMCASNYAAYLENRLEASDKVKSIFAKLLEFFRELRYAIFGSRSEEIFRSIESGEIAVRYGQRAAAFSQDDDVRSELQETDARLSQSAAETLPDNRYSGTVVAIGEDRAYIRTSEGTLLKVKVPNSALRDSFTKGSFVDFTVGHSEDKIHLTDKYQQLDEGLGL